MVNLQVVKMLSAPTSLASIVVIGPHHAAVTHVGDSSEVGQREHMVRQGLTRKCWSEFLCLGGYLAPPRQVGGLGNVDCIPGIQVPRGFCLIELRLSYSLTLESEIGHKIANWQCQLVHQLVRKACRSLSAQ